MQTAPPTVTPASVRAKSTPCARQMSSYTDSGRAKRRGAPIKGHPGARRLQQGEREQQAQGCTALAAVGNGVRRKADRHPPADRCPGAVLPDCGAHGAQTAQGCPDIRVVRRIAQARLPGVNAAAISTGARRSWRSAPARFPAGCRA